METLIQVPEMRDGDGSQLCPSPGIALSCRNQPCSSLDFSLRTAHIPWLLIVSKEVWPPGRTKTPCFQCRRCRFDPWSGNWDPWDISRGMAKKKLKTKRCDNLEWPFQLPNSAWGQLQPRMNLPVSSTTPSSHPSSPSLSYRFSSPNYSPSECCMQSSGFGWLFLRGVYFRSS